MLYIISVTQHKNSPTILGICNGIPKLINVLKGIDFGPLKDICSNNERSDKGCITVCITQIEENEYVNYEFDELFWICGSSGSDNIIFAEKPSSIDKYIEWLEVNINEDALGYWIENKS